LKIIEENGTVIPNANVTVKNKNGDIVINTTTDENGEISEYIQTFQHNNINEEGVITGGGYNTDFNPFTIQISKQGYKTLEFEETISGKKDWTLSLNEEEQSITPASLIVDKIISVESLNSSFIVYNITNKIVNRGGSLAKNVILFDSDSNQTEYYLGNLTRGNMTRISYLKGFQRNSTTYDVNLVVSRVEGNDSYLEEKISENSSEISLIVPSSTANSTLTLIKNVYYNSETSKTANYTITIDIINSGGKDLFDITIIDSDLDYSENINLNRTQKHSYSENIILNKSASNKNKLFAKTNAVVNSIIYESNQINIQIPGYGGPADAIVNAPASVKSSNTFDTEITVLNMNEDIGQDFVINYWITNTDETKNYSSGEQTIYVAALGESKVIATLSAPSDIGEFRFKAIVSWVGGVATSYDTFVVETYSSKISGSSIIETPENFTEKDEKKEESGNETNLEKNNETEQGGVSKEKGLRFLFEETMKKYLQKINSIKEKIDKKYFIVYLFFVILLSSAIYFKYLFHGKQEKEIRLKSMKGLKVYGEDGADVGKIKKIYLEKNKPKIYGWVILLNKNLSKKIKRKKVLIRHKHVKSIKQIMILEEKVSEHLEKFDKKN
jgi:sporulation protein YlmC with PRC-barrel domain